MYMMHPAASMDACAPDIGKAYLAAYVVYIVVIYAVFLQPVFLTLFKLEVLGLQSKVNVDNCIAYGHPGIFVSKNLPR